MARKSSVRFACTNCGAALRIGAKFCKACGSDDESGWATGADESGEWSSEGYSGDEDFDYDDYLRREFPDEAQPTSTKNRFKKAILILVVTAVCAALALSLWQ